MDRNPRLIRRVILPVAVVVLVAGVLFALQPIRVHADSMRPTLHSGDEIVIDRLSLVLRDPHRGELVVANSPNGGLVVKRVAALGGDSIGIEDGVLVVNGKQQREGYVDYGSVDGFYFGPVDVPKGEVFLLGDNRGNSEDSRDFGPVPEDEVVGRVLLRVWPLTR
jgi:signal peptidase I